MFVYNNNYNNFCGCMFILTFCASLRLTELTV